MDNQFDKSQVAESFGRAVNSYDSVDFLQRDVGDKLCNLINIEQEVARVVDVGCGTGSLSKKLAVSFSGAETLGVDISKEMIAYAKNKFGNTRNLKFVYSVSLTAVSIQAILTPECPCLNATL